MGWPQEPNQKKRMYERKNLEMPESSTKNSKFVSTNATVIDFNMNLFPANESQCKTNQKRVDMQYACAYLVTMGIGG